MGDVPIEVRWTIEVREKGAEMAIHFCTVLIDSLFFFAWGALNKYVGKPIHDWFPPDGVDVIVGYVLQALFAIATLAPIAIYFYRDIRLMWIRANQKIAKAEEQRSEKRRRQHDT
jgi:hypothetical protein